MSKRWSTQVTSFKQRVKKYRILKGNVFPFNLKTCKINHLTSSVVSCRGLFKCSGNLWCISSHLYTLNAEIPMILLDKIYSDLCLVFKRYHGRGWWFPTVNILSVYFLRGIDFWFFGWVDAVQNTHSIPVSLTARMDMWLCSDLWRWTEVEPHLPWDRRLYPVFLCSFHIWVVGCPLITLHIWSSC